MQLTQIEAEIDGIRRPLLLVRPAGTTERNYCAALAKAMPLASEKISSHYPLYGPVDLVIVVGEDWIEDSFSLFDRIYVKLEDSESVVIANLRRQHRQNKWTAKLWNKIRRMFNFN